MVQKIEVKAAVPTKLRDTIFMILSQMKEWDEEGIKEWIIEIYPDYKDLYGETP